MRYITPPQRVRAARREKWYMARHPTTRIGRPPSPVPQAERVRNRKTLYLHRMKELGHVRVTTVVAQSDRELLKQLAGENGIGWGEMLGRALRAWAVHRTAPVITGEAAPETTDTTESGILEVTPRRPPDSPGATAV